MLGERSGASASPRTPTGILFTERGLPGGLTWGVLVGSTQETTTTNSTFFAEVSGTYGYQVLGVPGYLTVWRGSATVGDNITNVSVDFQPNLYSVFFVYTGLIVQTNWSITLGGYQWDSNSSIVIQEPNGSYPFQVGPEPGYSTSWSRVAIVSGQSAVEVVHFTVVMYSLTFVPALPNGTLWSLFFNGTFINGTGPAVAEEPNGSYHFVAASLPGYFPPQLEHIIVNGTSQVVEVAFRPYVYPVTFVASGLPPGTSWSIVVGGGTYSTSTGALTVLEPNGTYAYLVEAPTGYSVSAGGAVSVASSGALVPVPFVEITVGVAVTETGLPDGTNWSIFLNGAQVTVIGEQIELQLPPGNYTFEVPGVQGDVPSPASGTFALGRQPVQVAIAFAPPTGTGTTALTAPYSIALVILVAVVLALVLALWTQMARQGRRGPTPLDQSRPPPRPARSSGDEGAQPTKAAKPDQETETGSTPPSPAKPPSAVPTSPETGERIGVSVSERTTSGPEETDPEAPSSGLPP